MPILQVRDPDVGGVRGLAAQPAVGAGLPSDPVHQGRLVPGPRLLGQYAIPLVAHGLRQYAAPLQDRAGRGSLHVDRIRG